MALTASGVGDCAFNSRGVSSRTISLTCKSCVRNMKTSIARVGGAGRTNSSRQLLDTRRVASFFVYRFPASVRMYMRDEGQIMSDNHN